jgi:hypothetical protein
MEVMVILITLTTTMAMDITDIPIIIITVMRGGNTIGVVMSGVNTMKRENIIAHEHNPQFPLFSTGRKVLRLPVSRFVDSLFQSQIFNSLTTTLSSLIVGLLRNLATHPQTFSLTSPFGTQ